MKQIFTVTELNENVKRLLEASFDALWVEGEVSNLRRPASGHAYFILKDEKSQIRAVIFRSLPVARQFPWARPMQFELEEGMSVICGGRLSVYHPRGEYQLIVEVVEPKGLGALQKAFEQLKARLQAEGLFDPVHKKRIPFLPQRIGVITSPTGAVIRDILHITARRFPSVDILIAPVRVQGPEAPPEIIRAIADMHAVGNIDVIILARGGGSLEDLASFNDEGVAREIFRSLIPVISAIGHEIDYTIADFVADLRAPTPSAAAELVMPVKKEIVASLETLRSRLINCMLRMREKVQGEVTSLKGRLRDPRRAIHDFRILVDDRTERLRLSLDHVRAMQRPKLLNLEIRLHHANPISQIRNRQLALESLRKSVIAGWQTIVGCLRMRMETSAAVLDTLSPLSVLRRGYGIIRTLPEGIIVKNAAAVTVDSKVDVKVSSGSFHAKVTEVKQE
ncbi:MAG: exodeoxyribonuclease VII large subunit [Deltaproteobacteria bacterium]|nr:exodeoxyribonuclease VII large subunit [Deltaproteobacteria bacterium]